MKDEVINVEDMLKIVKNTVDVIKINEEYLNHLDAEIGDADFGTSLARGFSKVDEKLSEFTDSDIGSVLYTTGKVFMETVGGAAGPLHGMFYIKASETMREKKEINKKDLAVLLEAGLMGVQKIGGGTAPGEKTMVDTLDPVVEALTEFAYDESITLMKALEAVTEVAREGMERTVSLKAKRGRASYLGERSLGHQDPGATSMYLILRTIHDTLKGNVGVKITEYDESNGTILKESYI